MNALEERYENLINSSKLFQIDREQDVSLWIIESRKLINIICDYYYEIVWKNKPQMKDNYSLELVDSIKAAIGGYRYNEDNLFLHYFRKILKNSIIKAQNKAYFEQRRQGIHVSKRQDKLIKFVIKYADINNNDLLSDETIEKIAEVIGISTKEVFEVIRCYQETQVLSSITTNEDGDEVDIYDILPFPEANIEQIIENREKLIVKLRLIDDVFDKLKGESKDIISILLTGKLLDNKLLDANIDLVKAYQFFNNEVYEEYILSGVVPTQREIAEKFGRKETSLSRTYKQFIEKLT